MTPPRPLLRSAVLVVAALASFALLAPLAAAQALPREVRQLILEAVVEVRPYDDAAGELAGWSGSGTIISPDGYILTNYHVTGDLDARQSFEWHAILVTNPAAPDQPPQHTYWARFVAGDPTHDLAILRIVEYADETPVPAGTTFPAIPVGDSNALIPGDPLTVVGYPGISGSTITFTTGIVSGWLGEDLETGGKQWIKTDAKIARGNSGGAAFDETGTLVGIPTLLQQRDDDGVFEEQFYLRPVAIAWALIGPNVTNVQRVGGLAEAPPEAPAGTSAATAQNPLAAGGALRESGSLVEGDDTLGSGEYYDTYEVELRAGEPVTVSLTSSEFDVYLGILDPDGEVVLEVDDSPGQDLDVLETFTPASSGGFLVVVSSARPSETGGYRVEVSPEGAAAPQSPAQNPLGQNAGSDPTPSEPLTPPAQGSATGFVGTLELSGTRTNRLAGSDTASYHTYVIEVPPGTPSLTVSLSAEADLDLFLKHGSEIVSWGDEGDWSERDISTSPSAEFTIPNPAAGSWYVDVVLFGNPGTEPGYSLSAR